MTNYTHDEIQLSPEFWEFCKERGLDQDCPDSEDIFRETIRQ